MVTRVSFLIGHLAHRRYFLPLNPEKSANARGTILVPWPAYLFGLHDLPGHALFAGFYTSSQGGKLLDIYYGRVSTMSSDKPSNNEQAKDKTFQVVDKRRFDSTGQERNTDTPSPSQTEASKHPSTTGGPSSSETAQYSATGPAEFIMKQSTPADEAEGVAFTSFIMSLATQVLVQLGEMQPPQGMSIPIDLESARQTIDIMTMLQRRTKGNLSAEEARFMEEVLHSLRVSYITAKKKTG